MTEKTARQKCYEAVLAAGNAGTGSVEVMSATGLAQRAVHYHLKELVASGHIAQLRPLGSKPQIYAANAVEEGAFLQPRQVSPPKILTMAESKKTVLQILGNSKKPLSTAQIAHRTKVDSGCISRACSRLVQECKIVNLGIRKQSAWVTMAAHKESEAAKRSREPRLCNGSMPVVPGYKFPAMECVR